VSHLADIAVGNSLGTARLLIGRARKFPTTIAREQTLPMLLSNGYKK
jgi:hypothetical protein